VENNMWNDDYEWWEGGIGTKQMRPVL
jgi:hypothetical protein